MTWRELLKEEARDSAGIYFVPQSTQPMPWYFQVPLTLGAAVASVCLGEFLFPVVGESWLKGGERQLIAGVVLVIAATGVRWFSRHFFVHQVCLALSMTGHWIALSGVAEKWGFGATVLSSGAAAAALYPLYRDGVHRFLSTLVALLLGFWWMWLEFLPRKLPFTPLAFYAGFALQLGAMAFIFLRSRTGRAWRPLGYALMDSLPVTLCFFLLSHEESVPPVWPAGLLMAAGLLGVCLWAAGSWSKMRASAALAAVLGIGIILLGMASTPVILVALAFLVAGFGLQNRALLVYGMIYLLAGLAAYYYSLQMDLGRKSYLLLASGVIVLALRLALSRGLWARPEGAQP